MPVHLGCCPEPRGRCLLCPPAPRPPAPATLRALVGHYERERGAPVVVGFFGGAPPSEALVDAIGGRPFTVRVRPDLFTRADLDRLRPRGLVGVELDVLTLDDDVLKGARRRYRAALVEPILAALDGLERGIVLAPGLPGSSFATSVRDAERLAGRVDTARLHPVLVLEHSELELLHMDQRYTPLTLPEAVTVCRAMADVLEAGGTRVVRIGLQPRADGYGRAVAGPRHSSLGHLVAARRALDRLRELVAAAAPSPGGVVAIRCHPADESIVRGPFNQHVRTLRADHALAEVVVRADAAVERGRFAVAVAEET